MLKVKCETSLKGHIDGIQIRGAEGNILRQLGTVGDNKSPGGFPNLITNYAMNRLMLGRNIVEQDSGGLAYLVVSSDNTEPDYADVSVEGIIARAQMVRTSRVNLGSPTFGKRYVFTVTFPFGSVVGNCSSVALMPHNTGATNPLTKALIRDQLGNPTTITVTAEEQLIVQYSFESYPKITDSTGKIFLSIKEAGVEVDTLEIDWSSRPQWCNGSLGVYNEDRISGLGDTWFFSNIGTNTQRTYVTGSNTLFDLDNVSNAVIMGASGNLAVPNGNLQPYVNNSFERETIITIGIAEGNITGGIGAVLWGGGWINQNGGWYWRTVFNPKIPKTNNHNMKIGLKISVARA